jgi:hypothetical protein
LNCEILLGETQRAKNTLISLENLLYIQLIPAFVEKFLKKYGISKTLISLALMEYVPISPENQSVSQKLQSWIMAGP